MYLLSRLDTGTDPVYTGFAMAVLGLGLGMVMQVLVLAVQNAVDYRNMGVATSGSLLFRQVGGSIGIALFGAIFTNGLHTQLADRLPPNVSIPKTVSPAVVRHLPPRAHTAYIDAVAAALHPVFVVATFVALFAFAVTWFLRDVPLRSVLPADGQEFAGSAAEEATIPAP